MTKNRLARHFSHFFHRLNPGGSFVAQASSEYNSIKGLVEDRNGPAATLSPDCFLQGSYRQDTAIHTINDVDVIALCHLWQPGTGSGATHGRDEIFSVIAAPLQADSRYRSKVRYGRTSMCIKVDLGIKVEILPVVYRAGNDDSQNEPFRLYRPESGSWEDGYARYHQQWLTWKNSYENTMGNFIPAIKVFKHLRSIIGLEAVSFHIECLLFSLPDTLFHGSPAEYLPGILRHLSSTSAAQWYLLGCRTPCGERNIFGPDEWSLERWQAFHAAATTWAACAELASTANDRQEAIEAWQVLFGKDFFPVVA